MTELTVHADVEQGGCGFSPDWQPDGKAGELKDLGLLRAGVSGGHAALIVRVVLRDGTQVYAETTWKLFREGALALAQTEIAREELVAELRERDKHIKLDGNDGEED